MKKLNYVLQENSFDCGLASLFTIFNYYNVFYNKEDIISNIKNLNQGISAYDIVCIAKKYNLNCKGVKTTIDNLNNTYFPCIAHILTKEGFYHYVVVISKGNNSLSIMDPAYGIRDVTIDEFLSLSTNVFILFDNNEVKRVCDRRFEKFIFNIFKEEKKYILSIFILSLLFIVFTIINNYYLKIIINKLYINNNMVLKISIIFIFVIILKNIFDYLRSKMNFKISMICDKKIFSRVIKHIIHLPHKYYFKKSTGEMFTIINDVENFKNIIIKVFVFLVIDFILIFIMLIFISFYNILYSLILFLFLFVLFAFVNFYKYKYNDYYIRLKSSKISYNSKIINYISSFETIKNLHIENNVIDKLNDSYNDVLINNDDFNKINNKFNFIYNIILDIFYILIICVSSIITIKNNLDFTNVILFSSFYFSINSFVVDLSDILVMYKVYYVSVKNVLDILDHPEEKFNNSKLKLINRIDFKNVSCELNFEDVNFSVEKGDRMFIKGNSGVGKSTLMKMLLKYFNDYVGEIKIDDINIRDLDLSFVRNNITYVGQNEFLYNDSIFNNLKIVNCSDEDINRVCSITGLDEYFEKNDLSLSYFLEDNGSNISGGERKRIILARALLRLKEVLILDEVFNEIEVSEEKKILENIFKYFPNVIIIYISHREDNAKIFNKIYELKGV